MQRGVASSRGIRALTSGMSLAFLMGLSGAPAAGLETPRSAEVDGVRLGMTADQLQYILVSRGFVADEETRRHYTNDADPVQRRVSFATAPGLAGPLVHQIDHMVRYPVELFDAKRIEAELLERFGEPLRRLEQPGRLELQYRELADAPGLSEVTDSCQAEIMANQPEMPEQRAEYLATDAGQYHPANHLVEELCPGTLDLYRRFARAIEAPRMKIVILPGIGLVETNLRWFLLTTPIDGKDWTPRRLYSPFVP